MKRKIKMTSIALAIVLAAGTGTSLAQKFHRGGGFGMGNRQMTVQPDSGFGLLALDLSEAQQTNITALRVEHQKTMQHEHNLLLEKEARLQTLLSAPDRDEKAINKTIDEISVAKADLLKKRLANREEMKLLLTDEQVTKLEANNGWPGYRNHPRGFGQRGGKGFGGGAMRPAQGRGLGPCGMGMRR